MAYSFISPNHLPFQNRFSLIEDLAAMIKFELPSMDITPSPICSVTKGLEFRNGKNLISDGTSVRARMAVSRAREKGEQAMWVMYFA